MDVSVIIPAHNAAGTLPGALQSAFRQDVARIEVIVVNDRSTDESEQVLQAIGDQRLKVIRTSAGCAAAARNAGLAVAAGRYIQFLDADDLLAPNKLRTQLQRLQATSGAVIANCPWAHFTDCIADARPKRQPIDRDLSPVDWLTESWSGGGMAQTACWLTPRSLIDAAGPWNTSLAGNPNDDGEFFCRVLLQASNIVFCDDTCVYYRRPRPGCVSQVRSEQQAKSLLGSYREYSRHLLQTEDSKRTRTAAAQCLYRFIYEYDTVYPHLCGEARGLLGTLGWPRCTAAGPARFRRAVRILGFEVALQLRRLQKRLRITP